MLQTRTRYLYFCVVIVKNNTAVSVAHGNINTLDHDCALHLLDFAWSTANKVISG